jgi:hypothetical protein
LRFDQADDDIAGLLLERLRALQRRIGHADAGRGTDEDQQPTSLAFLGERQQGVGIGPAFWVSFCRQGRHPFAPLRLHV